MSDVPITESSKDTYGAPKTVLKLYTGIRVDVTEAGQPPMELPDPEAPMDQAQKQRSTAYHSAVLASITETPLKKDTTSEFKLDFENLPAFRDLFDAVTSMTHTIEDLDGEFFGVTTCHLTAPLDHSELSLLRAYCQRLYDDGMIDEHLHCPATGDHGELSVHIWRSQSRYMIPEEEMKRIHRRKPKEHKKGGGAR